MPLDRLTAILPCRSRDELSQTRPAYEAEELLAAWMALWHPWLIATARSMPRWAAADSPPDATPNNLLVVPPAAASLLPEDWLESAASVAPGLVSGLPTREGMTAAALDRMQKSLSADLSTDTLSSTDHRPPTTHHPFFSDFLALGFCQYIVETVTQNLHYSSSLDEPGFEQAVVAAAEAACRGSENEHVEETTRRLQAAFDMLHTAREYYYHAESFLLDITLVADTTLGASLVERLASDIPTSLLISGRVLQSMAERHPETLQVLRSAIAKATASVIGGEFDERELPLLPVEAIAGQIEKGLRVYEQHLGVRPKVFGRRRFGMTPIVPQVVTKLGFRGIMHATLDDGRFPAGDSSRIRWEGFDGTAIDTLVRVPTDVAAGEAFQHLPHILANSRDFDSSTAALFAHWPGRSSEWYELLQRIGKYTSVLGSFATADDYFERTNLLGMPTSYKPDDYRLPYLRQATAAGEPGPLSRWVRYYARRAAAEAAAATMLFARLIGRKIASGEVEPDKLLCDVDDSLIGTSEQFADDIAKANVQANATLTRAICPPPTTNHQPPTTAYPTTVVLNPCSFARTMEVDVSDFSTLPDTREVVLAAGKHGERSIALVQVPAFGFACISPGKLDPPPAKRGFFSRRPASSIPMAEFVANEPKGSKSPPNAIVRNELFEVCIDGQSGAVRWLIEAGSRGPRLSQQLAVRLGGARGDDEGYSRMAVDGIELLSKGPIFGEVLARGRLVDAQGQRLAGFEQITRLRRGGRVVELDITLDPDYMTSGDPWESYYASRLAWSDEAANLYRAVNQLIVPTEAQRLESPLLTDIRIDQKRTSLLSGGLPYHRRRGLRKLDTLLIVQGETARRFRLGLGIDLTNPLAAAIDFVSPQAVVCNAAAPASTSGWIFHIDTRGVLATRWSLLDEAQPQLGFRVRLLETLGRLVSPKLRCFRAPVKATKLMPPDEPPVDLLIAGDSIATSLRPYEWAELEVRF